MFSTVFQFGFIGAGRFIEISRAHRVRGPGQHTHEQMIGGVAEDKTAQVEQQSDSPCTSSQQSVPPSPKKFWTQARPLFLLPQARHMRERCGSRQSESAVAAADADGPDLLSCSLNCDYRPAATGLCLEQQHRCCLARPAFSSVVFGAVVGVSIGSTLCVHRNHMSVRIEALERENAELKRALENMQSSSESFTREQEVMAKKHAQLHEDMEALASQSKMMMKEKTVLQRAHSASLLAQSQLKEELRALQHLMAAREAQRVREASERDALLAAGSQRIAEQDAALAVLRQRVATLRTELKLASEAEHAREAKLTLLEEVGTALLQLYSETSGGLGSPGCTLYRTESQTRGPVSSCSTKDEHGGQGCCAAQDAAGLKECGEELNARIDKLIALACVQMDLLCEQRG